MVVFNLRTFVQFNAPPTSGDEYGILVQDEEEIEFEGYVESDIWVAKYILRKNKLEEYYFSLIKI